MHTINVTTEQAALLAEILSQADAQATAKKNEAAKDLHDIEDQVCAILVSEGM